MNRFFGIFAALLPVCTALAAPAPTPFMSGWGKPVDPDKDCKIRREKGALTVEIPGTVHEYDLRRKYLNAPRLLRDIDGDFEMEVRVLIDCRPSAESSVKDLPSYVSAGFLVIPPDDFTTAFFRSEYRVGGHGDEAEGCTAILNQGRERGGTSGVTTNKHPDWPFKSKPDYIYLRLDRQGELLEMFISPDRKKWKVIGGGRISELFSKLKVGLAAFSTSTDPSRVVFDQLTITHGKKRERWEFVSGWSNPIDPDKDCKIKRDKDFLMIEMPGGDHDYDPIRKRFNVPRLLSELEGEFDLQLRVRIDSCPSAQFSVKGQPSFVSAGFLLIYPDKDSSICARLEYAVAQQGSRFGTNAARPWLAKQRRKEPAPEGKEADSHAVMKTWAGATVKKPYRIEFDHGRPNLFDNLIWERGWQFWPLPEKAEYAYLRLDHRAGGWSSFYVSPDGEKWTRLDYVRSVPAGGKVGLAAYSTSTEPAKVIFDQLKLARDKKKER
jgi:regulation of enolase protein 1 (concanavalin A-like superfamily)